MRIFFWPRRRAFPRYTEAARRVIFYALHGAASRNSAEIFPEDILMGFTHDKHAETCGFRKLHDEREQVAQSLGFTDAPWSYRADLKIPMPRLPLSASSKRVLARAQKEVNNNKAFWIDNEDLLTGILLEGGPAAATLLNFGYTLEATRAFSVECKQKWPPKKPTLKERAATYSATTWLFTGLLAAIFAAQIIAVIWAH